MIVSRTEERLEQNRLKELCVPLTNVISRAIKLKQRSRSTDECIRECKVLMGDGALPTGRVGEYEVAYWHGMTALHVAAEGGLTDFCEVLFGKSNCDVNALTTQLNDLPIHLAAMGGHTGTCEFLLQKGSLTDRLNCHGLSPLIHACQSGNMTTVETLINGGASVEFAAGLESHAGKPLHGVALAGDTAICELLIRKGADVRALDAFGRTPLHWAVDSGSPTICFLLLSNGADVGALDKDGLTPLDHARKNAELAAKGSTKDPVLLLAHQEVIAFLEKAAIGEIVKPIVKKEKRAICEKPRGEKVVKSGASSNVIPQDNETKRKSVSDKGGGSSKKRARVEEGSAAAGGKRQKDVAGDQDEAENRRLKGPVNKAKKAKSKLTGAEVAELRQQLQDLIKEKERLKRKCSAADKRALAANQRADKLAADGGASSRFGFGASAVSESEEEPVRVERIVGYGSPLNLDSQKIDSAPSTSISNVEVHTHTEGVGGASMSKASGLQVESEVSIGKSVGACPSSSKDKCSSEARNPDSGDIRQLPDNSIAATSGASKSGVESHVDMIDLVDESQNSNDNKADGSDLRHLPDNIYGVCSGAARPRLCESLHQKMREGGFVMVNYMNPEAMPPIADALRGALFHSNMKEKLALPYEKLDKADLRKQLSLAKLREKVPATPENIAAIGAQRLVDVETAKAETAGAFGAIWHTIATQLSKVTGLDLAPEEYHTVTAVITKPGCVRGLNLHTDVDVKKIPTAAGVFAMMIAVEPFMFRFSTEKGEDGLWEIGHKSPDTLKANTRDVLVPAGSALIWDTSVTHDGTKYDISFVPEKDREHHRALRIYATNDKIPKIGKDGHVDDFYPIYFRDVLQSKEVQPPKKREEALAKYLLEVEKLQSAEETRKSRRRCGRPLMIEK